MTQKRQRLLIRAMMVILVCGIFALSPIASAWATVSPANTQAAPFMQSLHGEWQFYWGQLLTPADFASMRDHEQRSASTMPVPASWRGRIVASPSDNDQPLPSFGVATYRKQFRVPPEQVDKTLSLLLYNVGSAYRVWVNGVNVGNLGQVGTTADKSVSDYEVPMIRLQLIPFVLESPDVDIVIQVSNYSFREGGIYGAAQIGETQSMTLYAFRHYVLWDVVLAGVLLAIGGYHLLVYVTSQRKQDVLLLGLLSTSMAIRQIAMNKLIALTLIPNLSWSFLMHVQHGSKFLFLAIMLQLNYTIVRQDIHVRYHRLLLGICAMGYAYLLVLPPSYFTRTLFDQTVVIGALVVYYLVAMVRVAQRERNRLVIWEAVGLSLFLVAMIHDVILSIYPFGSVLLVSTAIVLYLMMKSLISARRYVEIQRENDEFARRMSNINQVLEEKIVERTHELHVSNERLQELIEQRSHMMTNIAHDMGSPLIGLQSGLHVLADEALLPHEKAKILTLVHNRAHYVQQLADDLFRLSKLQSSQFSFCWEVVTVANLHAELCLYIQSIGDGDRACIIVDDVCAVSTDGQLFVRVDRLQIKRVLYNLIDNALKYRKHDSDTVTFRGSICTLPTAQIGYQFEVIDQGIGIAPPFLSLIFERFHSIRHTDTKSGHGLGLAIVKEIVHHHGGHVAVYSELGVGSTFCVQLSTASDKMSFDDAESF